MDFAFLYTIFKINSNKKLCVDMLSNYLKRYIDAIYDTDRARVFFIVDEALASGLSPNDVIFKLAVPSIEMIMDRIGERSDINLCQHFFVSEIASEVTEKMIARLENPPTYKGAIVIGTSFGDFHGLGKRIVAGCVQCKKSCSAELY